MLKLNYCPRCKGSVLIDRDYYGWYEQCIQCGYMGDLENIVEVPKQETLEKKRQEPSIGRKRGNRQGSVTQRRPHSGNE